MGNHKKNKKKLIKKSSLTKMNKGLLLIALLALATIAETRVFWCWTRKHYCRRGRCCVNDGWGINGCAPRIIDDCCHKSRHFCRAPFACDNTCGVHCIRYKKDGEVEFELPEDLEDAVEE